MALPVNIGSFSLPFSVALPSEARLRLGEFTKKSFALIPNGVFRPRLTDRFLEAECSEIGKLKS